MAGIVQHRRARDCMNNDPRRAQVHVNIRVLLNGRLLASPIAGSFPRQRCLARIRIRPRHHRCCRLPCGRWQVAFLSGAAHP
jgi:hypothetical protein